MERRFNPFEVVSPFEPKGDQPQAIESLSEAIENGERFVTLHGITGSGKSATMAWTIEKLQRPALVLAPNKSLAAQLAAELRELLPKNRVCFFVSYYDSYTPESYVPSADLFIEKQASVNSEIDRLRHEATASLLFRRDVVVVASVSCIYGLGAPEAYLNAVMPLRVGESEDLHAVARKLVAMGYERNDVACDRGMFAVRGDVLEIHMKGEERSWRIEFFGDEIERIREWNSLEGRIGDEADELFVWPATWFAQTQEQTDKACDLIEAELEERLAELKKAEKLLEHQRLSQRTRSDIELLREMGSVAGVENYSRHLDGRAAGEPPFTLVDYLEDDALVFIDESHVSVPQLQGAWAGDASRKSTLVEHGFRLPSAMDNRPLRWQEFLERTGQIVFVSATPGKNEAELASTTVPLVIRPTGLLDPSVEVLTSRGQLQEVLERVKVVRERQERVLVTTVTKKQAEDLVEWLLSNGVLARYLHSDVETLERIALVRDLRLGRFDVLVGVNLLREGLDMPEVSLVCILDADKEGFLRSETALLQTMGRAARNVRGHVVLFAERETPAMKAAIETVRARRLHQEAWNLAHGVTPLTVPTAVRDLLAQQKVVEKPTTKRRRQTAGRDEKVAVKFDGLTDDELEMRIEELEASMLAASDLLAFERAAVLRDELEAACDELESRREAS
jgi:excinuclease ABC subunit B